MTGFGDEGAVAESPSIPGLYGGLGCTETPGSGALFAPRVPWRGVTHPVIPLCGWKVRYLVGLRGCLPRDFVLCQWGGLEQVTHTTYS